MKIINKKLIEVSKSDLVDGVFFNEDVIEVGDRCFNNMPTLKEVNLPKATKFGNGCIYDNPALVSLNIPKATKFGSWCIRYNNALVSINIQKAKTFGSGCIQWNHALVSLTINNTHLNVKYVDGYCFVIEKQRKFKELTIYTGYNFGESIKCYVAEKDGFTAHGKTPKDAIKDLEFKIISEKMKNDPIDKDTVITVQYYRAVTGACEFGVRNWMKENNIEVEEIKAGELLPILKKSRAYGLEIFEKLLRF
jgi:hypothetical protein